MMGVDVATPAAREEGEVELRADRAPDPSERRRPAVAAEPLDEGHAEHAQQGESVGLGVRLLVSPGAGRLRHLPPAEFREGHEWVSAGQPVALVEQGPVTLEVRSPIDARVIGVLVRDGEPVALGQPLVWLDEAPRRTKLAGPPGDRR